MTVWAWRNLYQLVLVTVVGVVLVAIHVAGCVR